MAEIYHQVLIGASRQRVYDALTTHYGLSKWWAADCTVKAEVGFINLFRIAGHVNNRMKIVALDPAKYVEWECVNEHDKWGGTHIKYALSEKDGFTCLDFKHTGFADTDEFYATCNYQWGRHLNMLKEYCETGRILFDSIRERPELDDVMNYGED